MSVPPKADPVKYCEFCGTQLHRKRFGSRLEDYGVFLRRRFCGRSCASSKTDVGKSAHHWRAQKHKKDACEQCGAPENLDVHHKDRDHTNDDPANLATYCESCHLKLHWREDREKRLASNPFVQAMAAREPSVCVICGAEFASRRQRTQTCSPACKRVLLSRNQPVTSSGIRSVYRDAARGKWQARVQQDGKWRALGRFESADEAAAAVAAFRAAS